jgi:hypothetical protein
VAFSKRKTEPNRENAANSEPALRHSSPLILGKKSYIVSKLPITFAISHLVLITLFLTWLATPSPDPNHWMALLVVFLPDLLALPCVLLVKVFTENIVILESVIVLVGTLQWWLVGLGIQLLYVTRKKPNHLADPMADRGSS